MKNNNIYVAPQQLNAISTSYATAINQAANRLLSQLGAGHVGMRMYVELREAKAILKQLRYPEADSMVRVDEAGWALQVVKTACKEHGIAIDLQVFDQAASMLGIATAQASIPLDMQRKINNGMIMFGRSQHDMPLAQAV